MAESIARILRRSDVLARVGFGNTTLNAMVAAGKFPAPVDLTGARLKGWHERDVEAWIEARTTVPASTPARG
jgi:predicted DNA-binding transcriptional regulator AlpA